MKKNEKRKVTAQVVAMFTLICIGCILPVLFADNVNAEYVPITESPVVEGDVLIYEVQKNTSGNFWSGYYKYDIISIDLVQQPFPIKMIYANRFESEDGIAWTLSDKDLLIGKLSHEDIYFGKDLILQHRYFDFHYHLDHLPAWVEFKWFLQDEYQIPSPTPDFQGDRARYMNCRNDTYDSMNTDEWSYNYGILDKKNIGMKERQGNRIFLIDWNLMLENSSVQKYNFDYWKAFSTQGDGYTIGDSLYYRMNGTSDDYSYIETARYIITDCFQSDQYMQYLATLQVWNPDEKMWDYIGNEVFTVEYTLSQDIFHPDPDWWIDHWMPKGVDLTDPVYLEYWEAKNYWEEQAYGDHLDDYRIEVTVLGSNMLKVCQYNKLYDDDSNFEYVKQFADQGFLEKMIMKSESEFQGNFTGVLSLLYENSSITPFAPEITADVSELEDGLAIIQWDARDAANTYNVFIDGSFADTTTDTSYNLTQGEASEVAVTVTAVGNNRESIVSNEITISFDQQGNPENPQDPEDPENPTIPGFFVWTVVLVSCISVVGLCLRVRGSKSIS